MRETLLLGVCLLFVSGCKQIENAINEAFNDGTAYGLERCMEINETKVASVETTGMSCLKKIGREIASDDLKAKARLDGTDPIELWVSVDNLSKEYIFLQAIVSLHYYKNDNYSSSLDQTILFDVQPNDWGGEEVRFKGGENRFKDANFCQNFVKNDCFTWTLQGFGVSVR